MSPAPGLRAHSSLRPLPHLGDRPALLARAPCPTRGCFLQPGEEPFFPCLPCELLLRFLSHCPQRAPGHLWTCCLHFLFSLKVPSMKPSLFSALQTPCHRVTRGPCTGVFPAPPRPVPGAAAVLGTGVLARTRPPRSSLPSPFLSPLPILCHTLFCRYCWAPTLSPQSPSLLFSNTECLYSQEARPRVSACSPGADDATFPSPLGCRL